MSIDTSPEPDVEAAEVTRPTAPAPMRRGVAVMERTAEAVRTGGRPSGSWRSLGTVARCRTAPWVSTFPVAPCGRTSLCPCSRHRFWYSWRHRADEARAQLREIDGGPWAAVRALVYDLLAEACDAAGDPAGAYQALRRATDIRHAMSHDSDIGHAQLLEETARAR